MMQKYFQKSLKWAVVTALVVCAARLAHKKTDGFTLMGISSLRPHDSRWEMRPLTELEGVEVEKALAQPYDYSCCGGQSFVFFSRDGNYVIKFFKQRILQPSTLLNALPLPKILHRYREKRNWKRQDKLLRDFTSYKIAFEELQEHTGVIFVHLNHTNHLLKELTIKDKIGIVHKINLDQTDFIIQKKGQLVPQRIHTLMQAGKKEEAKQAIADVLQFIVARCKKGYHDRDPDIRTNCGFLGETVIKIDVGRLMRVEAVKQPEFYKKELVRIASPFQSWIDANYPELSDSLNESIEKVLKYD